MSENVVLAALAEDGDALKYAHRSLRAKLHIVVCAVGQSGMSFQYASDDLKANKGRNGSEHAVYNRRERGAPTVNGSQLTTVETGEIILGDVSP